ncbi:hypothetical protein [Amycolatopsis thermoflava]|uniref:Uncharacterized protein n=1 Tax=Amycolatopsis thermoflava TaxID=84480 RepID=A0A3N2GTA7_9PSEU|nr:hypothetical protein [Amycolatopsis thermoflava]ROS39803.1 hypothetical protein EDD35_2117 [Amycolatopsis thermoflava]
MTAARLLAAARLANSLGDGSCYVTSAGWVAGGVAGVGGGAGGFVELKRACMRHPVVAEPPRLRTTAQLANSLGDGACYVASAGWVAGGVAGVGGGAGGFVELKRARMRHPVVAEPPRLHTTARLANSLGDGSCYVTSAGWVAGAVAGVGGGAGGFVELKRACMRHPVVAEPPRLRTTAQLANSLGDGACYVASAGWVAGGVAGVGGGAGGFVELKRACMRRPVAVEPPRLRTAARLVNSLGDGSCYVTSAPGLPLGWAAGAVAGVGAGRLADRYGPRPLVS